MTLDVIITNGFLITMEGAGCGVIPHGALGIKGNRIVAVGEAKDILKQYGAHRYFDAKNKAVLPGLIDCHMHSSDGIARGISQDIEEWLYKGIWPVIRHADEEALRIGSMVCLMEAIKSGTTTVADDVNSILSVIDNHVMLGNRAIVSDMINELPFNIGDYSPEEIFPFDSASGNRKFNNNVSAIEHYHGMDDGRIKCMMGPQAPEMLSRELLHECFNYAGKKGIGIHMHVAQRPGENQLVEKRYGMRSIPFLKKEGFLKEDLLAVHLTDANANEIKAVADAGSHMVLCPSSIGVIDGRIPPAKEFLDCGGIVGLGTDQAPGNNRNNMFNEMKLASISRKFHDKSSTVFPCWKMLRMATIEAAQTLRIEGEVGSLSPGKKADLIIVNLETPSMTPIIDGPMRNIIPNLVYSANGSEVETVMIDGKIIVDNYQITTIDEREILRKANAGAQEFCKKVEEDPGTKDLPLAQWTAAGYY